MEPSVIIKRDGSQVPFCGQRIAAAIRRAQRAVGQVDDDLATELCEVVVAHLGRSVDDPAIDIETVQDAVIFVLQESGNYQLATAYLRYRDARERERRRHHLRHPSAVVPHLMICGRDTRLRAWDRDALCVQLVEERDLSPKAAHQVVLMVEEMLADTDVSELSQDLLSGLIDAAMVRSGHGAVAERRGDIRIGRHDVTEIIAGAVDGRHSAIDVGGRVLAGYVLGEDYPAEVRRLFCRGRMWIDGLDDPRRGNEFTAALDGHPDSWQIIAQAFTLATNAARSWRHVNLIIPPMIIGHLERGGEALIAPLEALSQLANCYLYCDGRTPLLDDWPFDSKHISIASYEDDFLLLGRLQQLGLEHLSGPHLMQGGYRRRVAARFALNAQGLEGEFSQLDLLAMALVAAARVRQRQLRADPELAGADIRYAVFGLSPTSTSNEYLERQVVQEGLRCGIALQRTSRLPPAACEHLGRLFDS